VIIFKETSEFLDTFTTYITGNY